MENVNKDYHMFLRVHFFTSHVVFFFTPYIPRFLGEAIPA